MLKISMLVESENDPFGRSLILAIAFTEHAVLLLLNVNDCSLVKDVLMINMRYCIAINIERLKEEEIEKKRRT